MREQHDVLIIGGGIVDPFSYTIALAENAKQNGVDYFLDHEVTGIKRNSDDTYTITTSQEDFRTRWIINSAGFGCDVIATKNENSK